MLLKKDTFKKERDQIWKDDIQVSLAQLEKLSHSWTNPENIKRLSRLKSLIDQMYNYQEQVENVAVDDTERAIEILDEKILETNREVRELIEEMSSDQELLMKTDNQNTAQKIALLNNIGWGLLIIGLFASIVLSLLITRSITIPVSGAVEVAHQIGKGNLESEINVSGSKELDLLRDALINMRDSLLAKNKETDRYNWLSIGQNKLNETMRGDKDVEELASTIVTFISEYIKANIGAVYLFSDNKKELVLAGKYAFGSNHTSTTFKLGEGIVGQVAAGKQTLVLSELDEKDLKIKSSLIDKTPKNIIVSPFLFEEECLGVIELGKVDAISDNDKEFIESNMEAVGIAINSSIARRKIKNLLEETQRQSEELQQQQEELEQSNEELEEQAQKLKEQQEELEANNEELEEQSQIVEQKNRDLETARTDIELKAKQLEISSKYKSEFLANMSHELRTPLNSLLILSNDLAADKEKNLSGDQIESAQIIAKSGYDLLNLINEILDLSKIESGKMNLNVKEVRVEEIAAELHRNFKHQAEKKKLSLEVSVDEVLPPFISTDRQRLEQILKNLISNAIKFTNKGNVFINFKLDVGNYLSISVTVYLMINMM